MRKAPALLAAAAVTFTFTAVGGTPASADPTVHHVLLLSLDGFHDFDLTNYVRAHPQSALAHVVAEGQRYSEATTQTPSDSFPTTLAMTTGGSPKSTGVYYDDTYDHDLYPPGSHCTGPIGTEVAYKQNINFNKNSGSTVADINPAKLPLQLNGSTCTPVYPHDYLRVNTIYEVAHAAGMRTAVADKHPAYEMLSGPSGTGLDDFYGPEFYPAKSDIGLIMQNDELKVDAVLNQIDGYTSQDNAHTNQVGVPAIFGMNFQSPNIGQKLSGYADPSGMAPQHITTLGDPSTWKAPGLAQALDYVDGAVGRMLAELDAKGLSDDTMIIVTAKHGNSPVDRSSLQWVDPARINQLINAAYPGVLAQVTADTMPLIWLKDPSMTSAVAGLLQDNAAYIGAATITSGADVGTLFGGQLGGNPSRIPDIVIQGAPGVLYDTGTKLVDHGSGSPEDTHVPLVVVAPGVQGGVTLSCPVSLRQVAPTILQALGLDPSSLDAVRLEGTQDLPATCS